MASLRPKSLTISRREFLHRCACRWCEGSGSEIETALDAAGSMDAIEAANPFGGFLEFFLGDSLMVDFGGTRQAWWASSLITMMFWALAMSSRTSRHRLIAQGTALSTLFLLAILSFGVPIEGMPVADEHLPWRSFSSRPEGITPNPGSNR